MRRRLEVGIGLAVGSAALFGASTPFAKLLLGGGLDPWLLAGLLCRLGSWAGTLRRRAKCIEETKGRAFVATIGLGLARLSRPFWRSSRPATYDDRPVSDTGIFRCPSS